MALEAQQLPVVFSGGQNNKVDSKNAPISTLGLLQNAQMLKMNKVSKRYGRSTYTDLNTVSDAISLHKAKNTLFINQKNGLHVPSDNVSSKHPYIGYNTKEIDSVAFSTYTCSATLGDYVLYCGYDPVTANNGGFKIFRISDGALVFSTNDNSVAGDIAVSAGTYFYILMGSLTGTSFVYKINTLDWTISILTGSITDPYKDIFSDGTSVWVVAKNFATPTLMTIYKYTNNVLVATTTTTIDTTTDYVNSTTYASNTYAVICLGTGTTTIARVVVLKKSDNSIVANVTKTLAGTYENGHSVAFAYPSQKADTVKWYLYINNKSTLAPYNNRNIKKEVVTDISAITSGDFNGDSQIDNALIVSRPIFDTASENILLMTVDVPGVTDVGTAAYGTTFTLWTPTYCLWSLPSENVSTLPNIVSRFGVHVAYAVVISGDSQKVMLNSSSAIPNRGTTQSGLFFCLRKLISVEIVSGVLTKKYSASLFRLITQQKGIETEYGAGGFVGAGKSLMLISETSKYQKFYDSRPYIISFEESPDPGNFKAGKTYLYKCCSVVIDEAGSVFYGEFSNTFAVVPSVECKRITLRIANPIRPSGTAFNDFIYVYRTEGDGSNFYLCYTTGKITGLLSSASDNTSDAVLITNPVPYTLGGVVENVTPGGFDSVVNYRGSIFGIRSEDTNIIDYTKPYESGFGPQFTLVHNLQIGVQGGGATALAVMDDKLIIFKETEIFYIVGNGADATGSNSTLSDAQLVSGNIGTVEPDSVCVTNKGIFFRSRGKIKLLDRGLNVVNIGAPVEEYTDPITSVVLTPNEDQVRFTTNNGNCLVYNMEFETWSVFTNYSCVDAVKFNNQYVTLSSSALLYENSSVYTDNGTNYVMKVQSNWVNFAGMGIFQRIRRLLATLTAYATSALTLKFYYDFSNTANTITYTPTSGDNDFSVALPIQKCGSFKFSIEDSGSVGNSFDLSGVSLEIGVKKGVNKLPNTRST